jgi:iron(III) transport system substrate-binding protein
MADTNNAVLTRRKVVVGAVGTAASLVLPNHALPQEAPVSPDLVAAANREGAVAFYTAVDLPVSLKLASTFMQRYPKIHVQVERTGAERITQRVMQEYDSRIKVVDVVDSSDTTGMLDWKDRGWLARYLPDNVVHLWPKDEQDSDQRCATFRAHLSVMGYNTQQVRAENAPQSFSDLLDGKWRGHIVKAHPAFAGSALVSTFAVVKIFGWDYFEKLSRQQVMQVQAAVDAVKKLALGERLLMFDGSEYAALVTKEAGNPVEVIYPTEGSALVPAMVSVMEGAPHPNAARLFVSYLFSLEAQQMLSDEFALRSFHPDVKPKPGRKAFSEIKVLRTDPQELRRAAEEIKSRYSKIFGV